ncbi:hypothetical protein DB347_16495 [Opitutaceae bacterium EW11]|nr:hypothetical protein DB347_16495 [Opitutaceae bacterium EW11]
METALQRVGRLIGSLETLSSQQSFLLAADDFAGVLDLVNRCQPLIDEIARLMMMPGVSRSLEPALQRRAQNFFDSQRSLSEKLTSKKTVVREQLDEIAAVRSRVHRLRGAYGTAYGSRSQNPVALAGQA